MFKLKTLKAGNDKTADAPRPLSAAELAAVSGGINPQPLPPIAKSTIKREV